MFIRIEPCFPEAANIAITVEGHRRVVGRVGA